jgi:hypothetical protein
VLELIHERSVSRLTPQTREMIGQVKRKEEQDNCGGADAVCDSQARQDDLVPDWLQSSSASDSKAQRETGYERPQRAPDNEVGDGLVRHRKKHAECCVQRRCRDAEKSELLGSYFDCDG